MTKNSADASTEDSPNNEKMGDIGSMSNQELQSLVRELDAQNKDLQDSQIELTQSLDRFSALYDSAPVGYVTIDRHGNISEANAMAAAMFGVDRERFLDCKLSEFVAQDSLEVLGVHRQEVFSGEKNQSCELEMTKADGTSIIVQLQCRAFPDQDGNLNHCRCVMIDVSEKKKAEVWRIESERFRHMVENLPAGAVFVDHQELTINKAAEEITGYGADELKTVDEWFKKLHFVEEHREIYEQLREGYFQEISPPVEIIRKDGKARMVKFACHRFEEQEIWLIYDLTDRLQAERELQRSQFALEHIEETVLWIGQDEGRFLFANDAGCRMFGYDHATFLTLGVPDIDVDISVDQWSDWWKRIKTDEYSVLERELKRSNGETFLAEVFPCYLDFGGEEFICVIVRDSTERIAAEQALTDSDELLRAILNSTNDGIVMMDSTGVIQMANPAVSKMTGYSEEELTGQNVSILLSSRFLGENGSYIGRFLETGKMRFVGTREMMAQRKDGSTFPVDAGVNPIEGLNQFTCVIRDISERKQLERAVLNAVEQEITRISAELHDGLGSTLTAVKMAVKHLSNKLQAENQEEREGIAEILAQLGDAIRQSRFLAKGLHPVDPDPEALVPALSALVEQLRSRSIFDHCHFEAPDRPVSISDSTLANQLYRITQEASHNAVKHSKATELTVELNVKDNHLVLQILDNGVGFDPDLLENGGLGLHIMKYRARMAGGTISIFPIATGGTGVRCIVPLN